MEHQDVTVHGDIRVERFVSGLSGNELVKINDLRPPVDSAAEHLGVERIRTPHTAISPVVGNHATADILEPSTLLVDARIVGLIAKPVP